MRHLVQSAGLAEQIRLDSAGTSAYHEGEAPDGRATATARRRGIILSGASRAVVPEDFARFDLIVAMDRTNREALWRMAPSPEARARVVLLRSFDPASPPDAEVPDPYYGGADGFERVLDICTAACQGLLLHLQKLPGTAARGDG